MPKTSDFVTYNPAGTDESDPAACTLCSADALRTTELRPSGHGFKVRCASGHVTNGMPRSLGMSRTTRK